MTLLILAGGRASRYGGNKQFDGVGPNGEYLLEYSLYDAITAGFEKVIIVCEAGTEEAADDYFRKRLPEQVSLQCLGQAVDDVPEGCTFPPTRTKPWGTAHAVWSTRHHIKGSFVTINADDFYGSASFQLAARSHLPMDHFGMVGFQLRQTLSENGRVSRGVCEVTDGQLVRIQEFTAISGADHEYRDEGTGTLFSGDEVVSMNMWLLDDSIFPLIERQFRQFLSHNLENIDAELYLPSIIHETIMKEQKRVHVIESSEQWMGLTFKEDRSTVANKLVEYVQKGIYPSPLWR